MIRSSHPFYTDFVTECPPCLTKMPLPGRGLAGTRPGIDKVSSSQMFKFRRRLNIHYLVGQGEKIVGSHESHAEKGSPLQVEGFRGERGGEGAEEDGPGQGLDTRTEAGVEAAPVDAEASQAGAQTQAGPQPRHPGPVTSLRVSHDVHIHVQGGDRCQQS